MLFALHGFAQAGLARGQLEVTAHNDAAVRLYRRLGFRRTKTLYKAIPSAFPSVAGRVPGPQERALLDELAARSEAAYRAVVGSPGFVGFFRSFTPVDELGFLEIGSRPERRPEDTDYLDSLRAIPWVFAWTQNRTIFPAWYGSGTASPSTRVTGGSGRPQRA